MIKIIDKINLEEVINDYNRVEKKIKWDIARKGKQCSLQYKEGDDYWSSSVGKSKGDEFSYDKLNPCFKDSIFEVLIENFKLKRTRLMWLNYNSCYSFHKDNNPRIHIPIISNDQCFFIFKLGIIRHLEVGNVYWVDTKMEHSAMNGSADTDRLHLVGVVEN